MPAITLGLAEVEERLQALRWRLNSLTAQRSVCVASATAVLLTTLLILVAVRASPPTFRIVAGGSALLLLAVVLACVSSAWWRWNDVSAIAHLVDERAQLADRLATLVDLRLRPRPARLAPVLVAQTLALGDRWEQDRIVRRRVSRSVYLLMAALLALASTTAVERLTRQQPLQAAAATRAQPAPMDESPASPLVSRGRTSGALAGQAAAVSNAGADADRAGRMPGSGLKSPNGHASRSNAPVPSAAAREGPASLTDRLQQAITDAIRGENLPPREQRGGQGGATAAPDARGQATDDAHHRSDANTNRSASEHTRDANGGKSGTAPRSAANATQGHGGAGSPLSFAGESPGAGEGSNPQGLMQSSAKESNVDEAATRPFTLTINSFLRTSEPHGATLDRQATASGTTNLAAPGAGTAVTLNERQLRDDALRKAEIPPEYEDVIRGVFSLRAGR